MWSVGASEPPKILKFLTRESTTLEAGERWKLQREQVVHPQYSRSLQSLNLKHPERAAELMRNSNSAQYPETPLSIHRNKAWRDCINKVSGLPRASGKGREALVKAKDLPTATSIEPKSGAVYPDLPRLILG
ncbi:hypothetical protein FB451DRAFT_1164731 [Mycena latifolia]|nr:hypothetical protein FB451DRAFT_1164731 [Mycena latifolia]